MFWMPLCIFLDTCVMGGKNILKRGIKKGETTFISIDFVWGADNSEQIPGSGECLSTFHKYSLMSYEILFTCLLSRYLD